MEDLCPPLCHELWNSIYPLVYALQNGALLDYGQTREKCSMQDVRMEAEFVFMEKLRKTENFRFAERTSSFGSDQETVTLLS